MDDHEIEYVHSDGNVKETGRTRWVLDPSKFAMFGFHWHKLNEYPSVIVFLTQKQSSDMDTDSDNTWKNKAFLLCLFRSFIWCKFPAKLKKIKTFEFISYHLHGANSMSRSVIMWRDFVILCLILCLNLQVDKSSKIIKIQQKSR